MRDDSFQFSRPCKACIPTRQFLAEIGVSWQGAGRGTAWPRVKSRASLDNSLLSHASACTCFHFRRTDEDGLVLNSQLLPRGLIASLFARIFWSMHLVTSSLFVLHVNLMLKFMQIEYYGEKSFSRQLWRL